MTTHLSGLHRVLVAASLFAIAGCSATVEAPADYTVGVGQNLNITLSNIGSGVYDTPVISAPIIRYLTVADVPPYTPGGPNQQFTFVALKPGRVTLTFSRPLDSGSIMTKSVVVQVE
jgi:hypothetical protein